MTSAGKKKKKNKTPNTSLQVSQSQIPESDKINKRALGRPAPSGHLTCRVDIYSQQGSSWAKVTGGNTSSLIPELLHVA